MKLVGDKKSDVRIDAKTLGSMFRICNMAARQNTNTEVRDEARKLERTIDNFYSSLIPKV